MKDKQEFSLESALEAHRNNKLHEWVVEYLTGEGQNKPMAELFIKDPRPPFAFFEYPLKLLERVTGPEEGMIYPEDESTWNSRVQAIMNSINEGWRPTPLIVGDWGGEPRIADGSHRHEALRQLGVDKYWTIFYVNTPTWQKLILNSKARN